MSNIEKWGYVIKTFNETSRSKLLGSMFSLEKIAVNYPYWLMLLCYLISSAIALYMSQNHFFYSVMLVFFTALLLFPLIERKLSNDLYSIYESYKLNDHPFFERSRYLHFIGFKSELEKTNTVRPEDVDALIEWNNIKNEKVDMSVFFQSKLFLLFVGGTIGIIGKTLTGTGFEIKELAIVVYLLIIFAWLFWLVFDFSQIPYRQQINLHRFLKWYALEHK